MAEKPSGQPQPQPSRQSGIPSNVVLIGMKPLMAYATAIVMQMNAGGSKELSVKARGRAISKAVDVVEVVRRRFFDGKLEVKEIAIGTQVLEGEEGRTRNVSTIEIKVAMKE